MRQARLLVAFSLCLGAGDLFDTEEGKGAGSNKREGA